MYDYLSTVTPDYTYALAVTSNRIIQEDGLKNQVIRLMDDGSEERVSFSSTPIFYVELQWENISESDSGTIFDWYFDAAKANARARSFKWTHLDGHSYVCRFDSELKREYREEAQSLRSLPPVRLKVLGRIADA